MAGTNEKLRSRAIWKCQAFSQHFGLCGGNSTSNWAILFLLDRFFFGKCLFFQTNQPFTQTCDICTHIVSYMVGKLFKRSTFLRTQLHSYDANLKSYEFIPHAGISYMWDLTPHHMGHIFLEGYYSKNCLFFSKFDSWFLLHGAL